MLKVGVPRFTRVPQLLVYNQIKKFPSLLSPESIDDTAFDAVSSKLADKPGAREET